MKVLIVEDEAPDRLYHRRIVESAVPGAVIIDAATREEAVQAIARTTFDLVLLDLSLEGDRQAGHELVTILRKKGPTEIVVISGLDVDIFRPLMYGSDVWDYFTKPVDQGSLRMFIQRIATIDRSAPQLLPSALPPDLAWTDLLDVPRWKGHAVKLTQTEKRILRALIRIPNQVVLSAALFDQLPSWENDSAKLRSTLSTHVSKIRSEFRKVDQRFDRIDSVGSTGYLWRDANS